VRQVYLREIIRTEPATPTYYTYDAKVDPGKILVVRGMTVWWDGFKTTESGQFFVEDGGRNIFIGEDLPDRANGHAFWAGKVAIGEGDRPGLYTPDSAAADVIYFYLYGELWDLNDWKKTD